ncbi:MAG: heme ABC exporter ATP-binding protein CcmA [Hyphomicrobiales bacterium]|nr:heme ABC exporter ATP-binding protein CcmA [Hyphomicrobiales bacterium]
MVQSPTRDSARPPAPRTAPAPTIAVSGLALSRGGRRLFEGLDVTLAPGDALTVLGANGAGKTSLLRALAGLLRPDAGAIVATGPSGPEHLPEICHCVAHHDALRNGLTVTENLAFLAGLLGAAGGLSIADALRMLGVARLAGLPAGVLSAGQRRRASLARLLVAPRPVWLLDEPTTALDSDAQATLVELIGVHRAQGGIVVVATHAGLALPAARRLALGRAGAAA